MDVEFDGFVRTTEPRHLTTVHEFYRRVLDNGDIYKGTYEGWYCVPCESFYTDEDLTDGLCPVHRIKPEWLAEENYFFALSKYERPLLDLYAQQPDFVVPAQRRNEVVGLLRQGLKDFSISRATVDWGIPLPNDPEQVVYVWFDALINYITGVGFGQNGQSATFDRWWPADAHVIGKDIVRFHAVYWPAMLMAADSSCPGRSSSTAGSASAARSSARAAGMWSCPRRPSSALGSTRSATFCCARSRSTATATSPGRVWRAATRTI